MNKIDAILKFATAKAKVTHAVKHGAKSAVKAVKTSAGKLRTTAAGAAKKIAAKKSAKASEKLADIVNTKTFAKKYKKIAKSTKVIPAGMTKKDYISKAAIKSTKKTLGRRKLYSGLVATAATASTAIVVNKAANDTLNTVKKATGKE
jgi:desulfoferrodoxin (superoxide reductase-like protein)